MTDTTTTPIERALAEWEQLMVATSPADAEGIAAHLDRIAECQHHALALPIKDAADVWRLAIIALSATHPDARADAPDAAFLSRAASEVGRPMPTVNGPPSGMKPLYIQWRALLTAAETTPEGKARDELTDAAAEIEDRAAAMIPRTVEDALYQIVMADAGGDMSMTAAQVTLAQSAHRQLGLAYLGKGWNGKAWSGSH